MTTIRNLISSSRVRTGLGILISAVCVGLALVRISWGDLYSSLLGIDIPLLAAGMLLYVVSVAFRAAAWRKILSPVRSVPLPAMFGYECVGYLANNVMPMRLGELVRVLVVAERQTLSKTTVLGTITLERLLDVGLLFLMGAILPLFVVLPAGAGRSIWLMGGAAVGLLFLLWLVARRGRLTAWLQAHKLQAAMHGLRPVSVLVSSLRNSLSILQDKKGLANVLFWMSVSWALAGMTTYTWMRAMHLAVPWTAALVQLVVINLGAMIPSSPGGLGVIHYLTILTLSIWAIDASEALAFAFLFHGVPYVLMILLGVFFLALEGISIRRLGRELAGSRTQDAQHAIPQVENR